MPLVSALVPLVLATPRDDAARLADAWKASGQTVERSTVFLERSRPRRVRVPATEARCTTVVVIGERHAGFQLVATNDGETTQAVPSQAGVAVMSACDDGQALLSLLHVEGKAARQALDVVVAHGKTPPPPPVSVLPERTAPPPREITDPGRMHDRPLADRVTAEKAVLTRWGATATSGTVLTTAGEGSGVARMELPQGCHRLALLPHDARGAIDLDAEVTLLPAGELLAKDTAESPDVHLAFCVAETSRVQITWRGAPKGRAIEVVAGARPLVSWLPPSWGSRGIARASEILSTRTLPEAQPASVEAEGTEGLALVPVELEAGACFLVLGAHVGGSSTALAGSMTVDGVLHKDDGGGRRSGFAFTACPKTATRTVVRVEARGSGLTWGLSVHRLGKAP